MTSNKKYFPAYLSPNIVISPTSSENVPQFKNAKNCNATIYGSTKQCNENISEYHNGAKKENLSDKSVPSTISHSYENQAIERNPSKEMTSNKKYFSAYTSPNIVIRPTLSENVPQFKNAKICNATIYGSTKQSNENISEYHNGAKKENLSDKSVPSTISHSDENQTIERNPSKEMISNKKYSSAYISPNIVISPTSCKNVPQFKNAKICNATIYGSTKQCNENISEYHNGAKKKNLSDKSVPSTISNFHVNQTIEINPSKEMISNKKYFSAYISPNIVISPKSCENVPQFKNTKICNATIYGSTKQCNENISEYHNVAKKENLRDKSVPSAISNSHLNQTIEINPSKEMISNQKYFSSYISPNIVISLTSSENVPQFKNATIYGSTKKCNENISKYHNVAKKENLSDKSVPSTISNSHVNQTKEINPSTIKKTAEYLKIGKNCGDKEKLQRHTQTQANIDKNNKKKSKMLKKIKIVINVTYNNLCETKKTQEIKKGPELDKDMDLTFLDDFDIDEVVESLFSCTNAKESTLMYEEMIKNKNEIGHVFKEMKNSQTLSNKRTGEKAKFANATKKSKDNEETKIKKEDLHISRVFKSVELHNVTNSDAVIKMEINNQKVNEKLGKILQSKSNKATERNTESKVLNTMLPVSKHVISPNAINPKEISQNISLVKKELSTVEEIVKMKQEKINYECSLVIKNEYDKKSNELTVQKLETMICDTLMEKHVINSVIHCGKFSKIFKCTNLETGQFYAVKMLNRECSNFSQGSRKEKMLREIQEDIPLENLSCIYLVCCFELDSCWCSMTHYYPSNLEQVLQNDRKSFNIDQIRKLSKQLVQAVVILRNKNIVHSDIRPGHILLNNQNDELKLCGFDEAYCYPNFNNVSTNMGTVNYRSPEIILGCTVGFSIDVWSTALVLYEMVTCCKLFMGETNNEILYKQICTFGNLPHSMIIQSTFKKYHFHGTTFVRTESCDETIDRTNKCGVGIKSLIFGGYKKNWGEITLTNHSFQLHSLCSLLEKMLHLDPRKRLPIEYVYANSFFFERN